MVPVVCAAVALSQCALASYGGLTPWKGGGFGMFAVIDGRPVDLVSRAYALVERNRS